MPISLKALSRPLKMWCMQLIQVLRASLRVAGFLPRSAPTERMIMAKEGPFAESLGASPLQAMCEMLSIVGKKLEESTKDKRRLEGYFVILDKWTKSKVLPLLPLMLLLAAAVQSFRNSLCCKPFSTIE